MCIIEENFSKNLLFSFFKFSEKEIINFILFNFILGNKINFTVSHGPIVKKNWIVSDNIFELCSVEI